MLKQGVIRIILAIWMPLFVAVTCARGQEEEQEATAEEIQEAQKTAQRFVDRMQRTRDVAALFDELFLPDFISHFVSQEGIYPPLYARLNGNERLRLFTVTYNLDYLSTVMIISNHDDMKVVYGERTTRPKLLLPRSCVLKLRGALRPYFGKEELKTYKQFRIFLPAMERALAQSRAFLKRRKLEQTSEFQKELAPNDRINTGINYRVRVYAGGENVKDCEPLVGFPADQRFFRVELPLLIGAILVKDGGRMKIVRLTIVDGD